MLTPSRTGLFPAPTQKATRVDYSKARASQNTGIVCTENELQPSTLRRRSSHGPSPLGRTVSTPPSPVVSKPSRRPLGRKSGYAAHLSHFNRQGSTDSLISVARRTTKKTQVPLLTLTPLTRLRMTRPQRR